MLAEQEVSLSPQSTQTDCRPALLGALVGLSVVLRMLAIARPLVGNFATKNVVYAMIARNWAEGRATLWYPTLDCLAGTQRSLHMLEFPVSAYLSGGLWRVLGGSLDAWGRATAAAFSVAAVLLLYAFARRRHGPTVGFVAAVALAIAPVSVIYGQAFMLEASLVFFTLATFYALDRWLAAGKFLWLVLAGLALCLTLLTKVYMVVLLLPLATMLWQAGEVPGGPGRRRSRWIAVLVGALAIAPAALWYVHAYRSAAPDGPLAARIFYSVRDSAEAHRPPHPLLHSPDFYRRLLDDFSGVVLTPVGVALCLAGLLDRRWRRYGPWLAAVAILIALLPRKFYEMNYYHLAVLPPLCLLVGLGGQVVYERLGLSRRAVGLLLAVALLFSLRYALGPVLGDAAEDRAVVAAGRAIQARTTAEEPVVTMHGTTIDLLYYCRRPGWAVALDTPDLPAILENHRRQGARYLVVAGAEARQFRAGRFARWDPVERGADFAIYALKAP